VNKEAAVKHELHQQEIKSPIGQSVTAAVDAAMARALDSTVRACVSKAQADMQVYTDGVESTLQQGLDSIRAHLGLAASDESGPLHRTTASDAEIGPSGHREAQIPRRPAVGTQGPYIPPPARGTRHHPHHSAPITPRSFELDDDAADYTPRHRMPKMDVPRFDGDQPKLLADTM
jgi:hypothetical protein